MSVPSQRAYDLIHNANLEKYASQVKKAYLKAINDISKASVRAPLNVNKEFYFRSDLDLNKKVNAILKELYSNVNGVTTAGVFTDWDLAVEKNNDIAQYVFGKHLKDLDAATKAKYFTNNAAAKRAFKARTINGLTLSDRVWNNTKQFKGEIELSLELGLGKGKSADQLSRSVRQYLNEPNKLYRRVRDEKGVLRLSKAAKHYKSGRGVYRSSYKNAQRLTRNEINFSYESSQQEKRKQQNFIVGIEIKVSPQHVPSDDKGGVSCIQLQGKYPKDFDWTYKWHVNCRCLSLNIIKSRAELDVDVDNILAGKEPLKTSKRQVSKLPSKYSKYIKDNESKWKNHKSQPRTFVANRLMPADPIKKVTKATVSATNCFS